MSKSLTRESLYQPGLPATPGQHYRAFVRFAARHAGKTILDVGCGYAAYSAALKERGYECYGCDINMDYLRTAASKVAVAAVGSVLPFPDRTFDTVLLFEVIEHIVNPETVLKEAFRVARRNVLITVPNAGDMELLRNNDVTYSHMLSSDHVNFFDSDSLEQLLRQFTKDVRVERGDPIFPFWFLAKSSVYYGLRLLYRTRLLKPRFYSRLYAVASLRQD